MFKLCPKVICLFLKLFLFINICWTATLAVSNYEEVLLLFIKYIFIFHKEGFCDGSKSPVEWSGEFESIQQAFGNNPTSPLIKTPFNVWQMYERLIMKKHFILSQLYIYSLNYKINHHSVRDLKWIEFHLFRFQLFCEWS